MKKIFLNSSMKIITNNKNYTNEQLEIILYGLESVYLMITKMVIIFGIAYVLDLIWEVIILLVTYNIIRSQAFGIHASKSSYCLISSLLIFIGGALICKYLVIPKAIMIIISIICNICIFLYAPADTHKRPLINKKKRRRFKIVSTILGIIYTILIIIYSGNSITNYLLFGMFVSVLMILPITYKLFKLPYNNYQNYKYGV